MTNLPPIPIPEPNTASILNTLAAMRQYIEAISGKPAVADQPHKNPLLRVPPPNRQPTDQDRWTEHSREIEYVRVINPADGTQSVVIPRTKQLVHKDNVTGEHWVYNNKKPVHKPGPTGPRRKPKQSKPQTGPTGPTGPTGATGPNPFGGVLAQLVITWQDAFFGTNCSALVGPSCGVEVSNVRLWKFVGGVWTIGSITQTIKGTFFGCASEPGNQVTGLVIDHFPKLTGVPGQFGWVDDTDNYITGLGPFDVPDYTGMIFVPSNPSIPPFTTQVVIGAGFSDNGADKTFYTVSVILT